MRAEDPGSAGFMVCMVDDEIGGDETFELENFGDLEARVRGEVLFEMVLDVGGGGYVGMVEVRCCGWWWWWRQVLVWWCGSCHSIDCKFQQCQRGMSLHKDGSSWFQWRCAPVTKANAGSVWCM